MKKKAMNLTILLNGTTPAVTRKVVISEEASLHELHKLIQSAMPWANSHLHEFKFDDQTIAYPGFSDEEQISSLEVILSHTLRNIGDKIHYIYDFGDNWVHTITLDGHEKLNNHYTYPYVESGENACPPEDCGSVSGFEELKNKLMQLKSEEDRETAEWANNAPNTISPYNPFDFNTYTHTKPLSEFDHERFSDL